MVVSIAGVAAGWIHVSPLQQMGMPGCGLGLRPHHIDEQKEHFPPSSDRNGTLTLVTASAGSQTVSPTLGSDSSNSGLSVLLSNLLSARLPALPGPHD